MNPSSLPCSRGCPMLRGREAASPGDPGRWEPASEILRARMALLLIPHVDSAVSSHCPEPDEKALRRKPRAHGLSVDRRGSLGGCRV